jgi:putative membrane protein
MNPTVRPGTATLLLAVIPLACIACGGSDQNMNPQAAGTTTTTSYATPLNLPPDGPAAQPYQPPANPAATPGNRQTTGPVTALTSPTDWTTLAPAGAPARISENDAQILAVLDAMNAAAVDQASLVATKTTNPRVRQLAQRTLAAHRQARAKLAALELEMNVTPEEGPTSDKVRQDDESALLTLRTETPSNFDRAYLKGRIDEQRGLLVLVDRFIDETQSARLKSYLEERRSRLAEHLRAAEDVQSSLPAFER